MRTVIARGQRQASVANTIPAPINGINAASALAAMNPLDSIYAYDMVSEDYGMKVREGSVEWANGWTGGAAKTVIPFEGNVDSEDKLFIANEVGIWDVTTEGETAPTLAIAFPAQTDNAGICSYINFTNDGNARFLLVCDGENGYYTWEQATNTWTKITQGAGATQIDGVDPASFDFVMVWKKRVWFIQRESTNAWYLGVGVFLGTATSFNFGDQFVHGGTLRALDNWTLDGGDGLDDRLVAVSGAGDVAVYQGTDPTSATTFGLTGTWYIGDIPLGRRVTASYAGELYVLSSQGLMPMSDMTRGNAETVAESYLTNRISPYIRSILVQAAEDFGWQVHMHPTKAVLYITSPMRTSQPQITFAYYYGSLSWSMLRNLDKNHSANWQSKVFWVSSIDNRVFKQAGDVDRNYLDKDADGQPEAIEWDLLTAYQLPNQPNSANYKRVQFIRPMFVSGGIPVYDVQARYDFNINQLTGSPTYSGGGVGVWDEGIWGESVWGGGADTVDVPRGASGIGRHIAVNIRGRSAAPTVLAAFDIIADSGGLL